MSAEGRGGGGGGGDEDALEGLPLILHSGGNAGGGVGVVGCSFSNDSHLSKLWMLQPLSQHPTGVGGVGLGGRGGVGAASITAHVI